MGLYFPAAQGFEQSNPKDRARRACYSDDQPLRETFCHTEFQLESSTFHTGP
jgi:hypothetical protein